MVRGRCGLCRLLFHLVYFDEDSCPLGSRARPRPLGDNLLLLLPLPKPLLSVFFLSVSRRGGDSTGVTDRVVNQLLCYLDGVEDRQVKRLLKGHGGVARPDFVSWEVDGTACSFVQ